MIRDRALSALLSQALVAFTLELDDAFESGMGQAGFPGASLSYSIWANLIRFVGPDGVSVRRLAKLALTPEAGIKFELGCLERWGYIVLVDDPSLDEVIPTVEKRDGWGSGRGIRAPWIVRLTRKGLVARKVWMPLAEGIEDRWRARFGAALDDLTLVMGAIANQLDLELPHALTNTLMYKVSYPLRHRIATTWKLPTLLAMLTNAFRIEFDRVAPLPLELAANTLRVLGESPVPESELANLTGCSPEMADIGWPLRPYVIVEPLTGGKRGKGVRLSEKGWEVQSATTKRLMEVEELWASRYGAEDVRNLRNGFEKLIGSTAFRDGLVPSPGTRRAGFEGPALGRKSMGVAAQKRNREMVAQSAAFQRDPAGTLPHFPLWDMNRGFGP